MSDRNDASPDAVSPKLGAGRDEWFTPNKLLLLLAMLFGICFPTVLAGLGSFFYRDMGQFGYPLALFHREAFWHGEIPLWNPLNNCGLPFLAQWNTLVLYPGSLIYLLPPLPSSMDWFMFAHLLLAAAGMHALAKRWTGDGFAASVAGLAFAWNGLTLHALMWPNNLAALGWMPWVVLALERAGREGGRHVIIAALVGTMQMLTGAPEIILLTWLVGGLLWLRDFLSGDRHSTRGVMVGRMVLSGALVFALCAAQLLPFLDLLRHSQRDSGFGGADWAMPLWGWANFLVPMFGCTPSVTGVYSQDAQQWTSSYYLGIGTVAFALLAWRAGDARVKWLAGFTLAGLLLALGEDGRVLPLVKKVFPPLGFIRFPIKYVVLVVFALPLLAAFGVKGLVEEPDPKRARRWINTLFVFLLVSIVAVLGWAHLHPVAGTVWKTVSNNATVRGSFLLFILGALSLSLRFTLLKPRFVFSLVLVLMATDVLFHMPRQNPVVPNRGYGPLPLPMSSVPRPGESRAMISPPMHQTLSGLAHPDPLTMFTGHRRMLLSDCNLLEGVPKVNGFYSLYLRETDEVIRRLYHTTNYDLPLLDFLGVTQISDADAVFVWHARPNAMPLITAGQAPVFMAAADTLDGIFSPTFNPRRSVFLPPEAKALAGAVNGGGAAILSSEMKPSRVTAEVQSDALAIVAISQAYSVRWKAYMDGRPAPLWRANHGFQAVLAPAGKHRVELRYEDTPFRIGAVLSAVALLGCGAGLARRR